MNQIKALIWIFPLLLILSACDNELDLIEEWKDIPIVYGIVDPSDTAHYIRVEKAFVDAEVSGADLALFADSLYYEGMEVQLVKGTNGTPITLERVDGNLEGYPRQEGAFAQAPNFLYKVRAEDLNLQGEETLNLYLKPEGQEARQVSSTRVIGDYDFLRPRPDDPEKINFSYANHLTIRWNPAANAVDYEIYILVHYTEKEKTAPDTDYVPRFVTWKAATGVEGNSVMIESKEFFVFVNGAIQPEENLVRIFKSLEFRILAVGEEVSDYIEIGGANLGITSSQEIPQYSNIEDGLGIFSSTREISLENLRMIDASLDSLRFGIYTKQLNFQ